MASCKEVVNHDCSKDVYDHVTSRMIHTIFQDIKIASGFFDLYDLHDRIVYYLCSIYGVSNDDADKLTFVHDFGRLYSSSSKSDASNFVDDFVNNNTL